MALVNLGLDIVMLLTDVEKSLNFIRGIVRKTPLLEFTLIISLVHGLADRFDWAFPVWHVKILSVDLFDF